MGPQNLWVLIVRGMLCDLLGGGGGGVGVGAAQQSFMKVGFWDLHRYGLWNYLDFFGDTLVFKWDGILGLTSMYVFC